MGWPVREAREAKAARGSSWARRSCVSRSCGRRSLGNDPIFCNEAMTEVVARLVPRLVERLVTILEGRLEAKLEAKLVAKLDVHILFCCRYICDFSEVWAGGKSLLAGRLLSGGF